MKRFNLNSFVTSAAVAAFMAVSTADAAVSWDAFQVRDSNGDAPGGTNPVFAERISQQGIDTTVATGEKVGYGTSHFNGQNVADVPGITWDVLAAPNMNTANEKSPYLNLWIGKSGSHAVIAPFSGPTTNVNGLNWDSLNVFIYESDFTTPTSLDWIESGAERTGQQLFHSDNTPFTIGELGALGVVLEDPGVYPNPPVGAGAPKHGTAFNLIFGDSASNYVGTYSIDNIVVPEPTGIALTAMGAGALLLRRRRRNA
ncbi:MAG: PEP-CTERM sorting domain-containing protein [Tepidisphaeraceae bacterium]